MVSKRTGTRNWIPLKTRIEKSSAIVLHDMGGRIGDFSFIYIEARRRKRTLLGTESII